MEKTMTSWNAEQVNLEGGGDVDSMDNFNCDFCGKEIENDWEGGCFDDGTAFCHLDFSDDIACESCYEKGLWHEKHKEVAKDEFGSWLF